MPDEPVSQEELSAAADEGLNPDEPQADETQLAEGEEVGKEEPAEEPIQDPIPDEPVDNTERSNLGRKVAAQGETLSRIEETLAELQAGQRRDVDPVRDPLEDVDDDTPLTKGEVKQMIENAERKKAEKNDKYVNGYRNTLAVLARGVDPEFHQVVVNKMMADHNVKHSDDAVMDARLNYANAKADVLGELATKKSPFARKAADGQNLGGSATTTNAPQVNKPKVKLDPYAQDFVDTLKRQGKMTDEEIAEALEGDAPAYIR